MLAGGFEIGRATIATFERPDGRAEWLNDSGKTRTPAYEGQPIEPYVGVLDVMNVSGTPFLIGSGVGGGSTPPCSGRC